jgi:FkbM family methyltransferase
MPEPDPQPGPLRLISVATPAGPRSFHHRGTTADRGVVAQSFGHGPEKTAGPPLRFGRLRARAARILAAGKRPLILDLGANIGATALRFAVHFPAARVIALEPHEGNAALAERNTEGLDVDVRRAAIGPGRGEARIVNPSGEEWGFRMGTTGDGPVVAVTTVPDLIAEAALQGLVPFILKCDIEGAEEKLFDADSAWFDDFAMVSCEPHDWMMRRRMTINGFLRAHLRTPRQFLVQGDNLVSLALDPVPG